MWEHPEIDGTFIFKSYECNSLAAPNPELEDYGESAGIIKDE